jgi:hypothetical protein
VAGIIASANTPEKALNEFLRLAALKDADVDDLDLGEWVEIAVYLPKPSVDSSITPPFMEAFLQVQKQLYQLAVLAKSGAGDTKLLSETDLEKLLISVRVSGGSSDLKTNISEQIKALLPDMMKKLTKRQTMIVILGLALLVGAAWSWNAWLENQRLIRMEEIKSQTHIEALKGLSFSNSQQLELLSKVIGILDREGVIGKRVVEVSRLTNDALLRAASKSEETEINGVHLTKTEADTLRVSPRRKPKIRYVKQEMRVIDINTEDALNLSFVLLDDDSGDQHRLKSADTLFAQDDRKKLFAALASRESIWVELALYEAEGELKSVEFLRVVDEPGEK